MLYGPINFAYQNGPIWMSDEFPGEGMRIWWWLNACSLKPTNRIGVRGFLSLHIFVGPGWNYHGSTNKMCTPLKNCTSTDLELSAFLYRIYYFTTVIREILTSCCRQPNFPVPAMRRNPKACFWSFGRPEHCFSWFRETSTEVKILTWRFKLSAVWPHRNRGFLSQK